MPNALVVSMVKVSGINNATPMVADSPGSAPNTRPRKVPAATISRIIGLKNVAAEL